ncbi:PSD1 and planctomycete cytochrome C domain-containing protein [Bythopirellula polymerisocia]|uniref:Planctomycete cytochrome C n=1 Tax=Bythopirellula polymerisocia TaxID=2528003 RepID=A0A5C6CHC3_9BACT|nr:PSD1 and planctomycete cytochrome C domain-containing protein [Bythopirellula polymerisocia]TWU23758.1 Planctomycete cytochrome C [Bythopirellula polymerisocia]
MVNSSLLARLCLFGAMVAYHIDCADCFGDQAPVDFNRDIRPLLSENCFACHGPDSATREADLRLDQEDSAKEDRGGYAAIVAEDVSLSELVRRIESSDEDEQMPPPEMGKHLTGEKIALFKRWISEGAVWSPAWSYVPPKWWRPPVTNQTDWNRNWIDQFVLAKLEAEDLPPSQQVDPVTLVRRLSFDLTGLPPEPEVVDKFVADPSDKAYERLVDEFLASPHYGERMAMMWLDLVRYADSVGYHGDQEHNIWPYRDYVIHAFNGNMRFDEFTREQLAGDLLPDSTEDQVIATGYNRLLQTSHEGGIQLKEYRAIYLADRVRNVSQVWMGATMGCCQCHDHKYDPYSARDFYAMGAFFADIDDEWHLRNPSGAVGNTSPTVRKPEKDVLSVYQREELASVDRQIASLDSEKDAEQIANLLAQREALAAAKSPTMITESTDPREVRLLGRGDWQDESGEIVTPAIPDFLGDISQENRRANRLDLANWLTDPESGAGGLTARVMVNRYWALMFGEGLARVLDDFGGQGEPPSHPELLDNLAVEYLENGWDTKHMIKLIAMSNAYRQTAVADDSLRTRDPLNRLVARQNRFRLPAEMIRDTTLAVSGLLVDKIGGRSVRPMQPAHYYQNLNFPEREYEPDTGNEQWRRGVYMHWQRTFLHPMLKALDAPTREECTAHRPKSNTALAALVLLNDPNSVEAARAFASRILSNEMAPDDNERIECAFREAVSRLPDDRQYQVLADLLSESRSYCAANPLACEELLGVGMSTVGKEHPPEELASWTTVCRAILNMSETTTRN